MYKQEIDKNFIDYLRLNWSTTNWIFDKAEKNEIVPKELTHDYLLRNFNIDESIYKYYHLPTSEFLSDSEFQEMKDTGFIGKKETALNPYSNIIYGAYYSRSDLHTKLSLVYSKRDYTIEGKEIKYFADLIPYFKEYAKGFENGFNEFDNSQIKPFLTMLAEKQDYVNKVFEFVTKRILFLHSWATLQTGFTTNQNNEIIQAFENGQKQGYFYRAWSVIFSNHKLFAPLFQEHLKALPPQQNETKTDKLKAELGKYGFFELSKVKQLSEPNKQSLIELISTNDLPYSIAMFEYLGFLKHLKAEHFTTDYKLFKAVAKWFEVAERAVKGNIYVLNEHSKENRTRYTADQQKQTVQKDYEKIK